MKKSNYTVQKRVNISAEEAWDIIGSVSGVDKWLGPITACRVEGSKRFCSTEDGAFEENILKVDHENKVFKYDIPKQHLLPVQNIIGEMSVHTNHQSETLIRWSWSFEVAENHESGAKETLEMMGNMGIDGIEQLVHSRVT